MALVLPPRDACFAVFSQRADAPIDRAEWVRHAERFFETRLALSDEREFHDLASSERHAAITVTVTPLGPGPGVAPNQGMRICTTRRCGEDDLRAAREAEVVGAGLAELTARCPRLWLIATADPSGAEDALALRLAAILAGLMLGPILSPRGTALFGPKTARQRLGL